MSSKFTSKIALSYFLLSKNVKKTILILFLSVLSKSFFSFHQETSAKNKTFLHFVEFNQHFIKLITGRIFFFRIICKVSFLLMLLIRKICICIFKKATKWDFFFHSLSSIFLLFITEKFFNDLCLIYDYTTNLKKKKKLPFFGALNIENFQQKQMF